MSTFTVHVYIAVSVYITMGVYITMSTLPRVYTLQLSVAPCRSVKERIEDSRGEDTT